MTTKPETDTATVPDSVAPQTLAAGEPSGGAAARKPRAARVVRNIVLALAVILFILAGVLGWQARSLRDDPALVNRAQLDESIGDGVSAAVSRGLTQVLSYDYAQPDRTRNAADQVLSGQARDEYDTLFASLQDRAPDQKLVLTAQVQVAAIRQLSDDRATLLVFVDQSSTRAKDKESSVSAAQLSITAKRSGATWVITGLKPL
jgi:Mce-associated membrane protein